MDETTRIDISEEEIIEAFKSSLNDLTVNSKPHIGMLTLLAEDNMAFAPAIVAAIEDHLQKVSSEIKLVVLYLIDSILKAISEVYLPLFAQNIVTTFCSVFQKVDENTRACMWKLRQTWNGVFPNNILYNIDKRVNKIDPAWPVIKRPKVNSAAKQKQVQQVTQAPPTSTPAVVVPPAKVPPKVKSSDVEVQEQLIKKRKELIELQKRKVELELLQVKASLEQQRRQLDKQTNLKTELPPSPEDALEKPKGSSQILKPLEKQFPAAASLLKSDGNKSGVRIAPASSIAVASAKPIHSRDPRMKPIGSTTADSMDSDYPDEQELIEQLKLHVQSKLLSESNLLKDAIKGTSEPEVTINNKSLDNKRAKDSCQKAESDITINTTTTTSSRNNIIKDKSKSSSSSKRKGSSSSSSRKSKNRSSTSSSSSLARKIAKLGEGSPRAEKRYKKSKSRKSPSPPTIIPLAATAIIGKNSSYRIPRRVIPEPIESSSSSNSKSPVDAEDEEENERSSPSDDIALKSIARRINSKIRKANVGSSMDDMVMESAKDEDLRTEKKDLDLRILAVPTNKRQPSDMLDSAISKKSKSDKYDTLFGSEDVDLRKLTNPKAGQSQASQPAANAKGWAKLKIPLKSASARNSPKTPTRDQERDRLGRPRLYNKFASPDDPKSRRPLTNYELEKQTERNADRNIEIIMKQAAEQLSQGAITKAQYNTLIQEVLHMRESQKLRAAQRMEKEMWESSAAGSLSQSLGNDENIPQQNMQDMQQRGQMGPRWPTQWRQPWGPPPFGSPFPGPEGFRPMGPWNPRMFSHMRPDFQPFFNARIGPLPPPPPPPPPLAPNGPLMMPNGPMPPMGPMGPMGPMPPVMMMGNGPMPTANRASPNQATSSGIATSGPVDSNMETDYAFSIASLRPSGDLPPADRKLLEEISRDTMKSINIDNVPREIRYYGNVGVVFMSWDDPRDIGFQSGTRKIFIESGKEKTTIACQFNNDYTEFAYDGEIHRIKLGTPTRELYVDDKWYECYFGGRPIDIQLGNKTVKARLDGPIPQVKIGTFKRTDLVLGKINLIINARQMVPIFLDAKPQLFDIEGQQCTLEFVDSLQTVLLNGWPYKVEFGGLPKPIMIGEKKHFIRFSVLPRGFHAGYVKIKGMRGEPPKESEIMAAKAKKTAAAENAAAPTVTSNQTVLPGLDLDQDSQDGTENPRYRPDSQIDVLSSVVPSAMAPSSGLSYSAEPSVENAPTAAPAPLSLTLNELFQKLVQTGMVPSVLETKKPEEKEEEKKKEPVVIPVSFDKPETLKVKQPAIINTLFTGMQCSSCGIRFLPEMAARYSHHLDWHFRQNRKERDTSKRVHSRVWYYDVSDWIQFEEIEDLEDRAQSWFETEKQMENESAGGDADMLQNKRPSVPTGPEEELSRCEVCHEAFEQFYHEEKEEWHFKLALRFEAKNYHPICLEDYKRALEKSAKALEQTIAEMEEKSKEDDGETGSVEAVEDVEGEKEQEEEEEEEEEEGEESPVDDDDDVKPLLIIKTETIDSMEEDEDIEEQFEAVLEEDILGGVEIKVENEDDQDDSEMIEIIEPVPKQIELEEIDDSSDDETVGNELREDDKETVRESIRRLEETVPPDVPLVFEDVIVKEEPLDDGEMVGKLAEAKGVDTTHVEVKSSIDGNVEFDTAAPAPRATMSKIKLNITKSVKAKKDSDKSKKPELESPSEPTVPSKPLIPAAVKPSLQGKKLSIMPTVEKGQELSGLCSIM